MEDHIMEDIMEDSKCSCFVFPCVRMNYDENGRIVQLCIRCSCPRLICILTGVGCCRGMYSNGLFVLSSYMCDVCPHLVVWFMSKISGKWKTTVKHDAMNKETRRYSFRNPCSITNFPHFINFPIPLPHLLIIPWLVIPVASSDMAGMTTELKRLTPRDAMDHFLTVKMKDSIVCHPNSSSSFSTIHHFLPLLHPSSSYCFDQNLTFDTPITFLHFSKLIIWYPSPASLWLLDHFLACLPSLSSPTMKIDYSTCSFFRSSHSFLSSHPFSSKFVHSFNILLAQSFHLSNKMVSNISCWFLSYTSFFPNISTFLTLVG